jgi:hypothetical protein
MLAIDRRMHASSSFFPKGEISGEKRTGNFLTIEKGFQALETTIKLQASQAHRSQRKSSRKNTAKPFIYSKFLYNLEDAMFGTLSTS